MPDLYLANPTRQVRKVYYRLDISAEGVRMDKQPPKHVDVLPGRQTRLRFEHPSQVEIIVRQLSKVGARAASEKNRLGNLTVPIVFSADKPVPTEVISEVHRHNRMVNHTRAQRHRQAIALASSQQVQEAVDSTMSKFNIDGRVDLKLFEAEIEMSDDGGGNVEGKAVGEGLRVRPGEQGKERQKPGPKPGWKKQ